MSRLSATIASALFLALLGAGLFFSVRDYIASTKEGIGTALSQRLLESTQYAAANFQRMLSERIHHMEGLARFLSSRNDLLTKESAVNFGRLEFETTVRNFAILGPDGKGFSALGNALDMSGEAFFQRALKGESVVSAHTVPTHDQRQVLVVAVPVLHQGEVRAVLTAGIDTAVLQVCIQNEAFGRRTYNLILDSQGHVVLGILPSEQALEPTGKDLGPKGQIPVPAAAMQGFFTTIYDSVDNVLRLDAAGGRAFYAGRALLAQNGWQMVSLLPESFLRERITMQNVITRTLIVRVAILFALLWLYLLYYRHRVNKKMRNQQEEFSAIAANISGGIQKVSNTDGTFIFLSQNYLDLLGYSREEFERIYENTFANTIYEEDRDNALATISKQLKVDNTVDVEYRTRAKNGNLLWLSNKGTLVHDESRQPYIASIVFDITHSKEMQQAQRISDERYHFILEQHDIIVFEQDMLNGEFYCSTRWMQLFGLSFNILEPDPYGEQIPVHAEDRGALEEFQEALQQGKRVVELRLCDVDGLYRWYKVEASTIMDDSGWPVYVLGIITDIDSQKSLELSLRNQAACDSATGMYNKLATEQAISNFLERQTVDGPGVYALFMIDLDNFKIINDRLGHAVGDQAICTMSRIIRQNFRTGDIVGRIGGDEFLVFCTERLSMQQLRERAVRLGAELHTEWGEGENRHILTASMGVACAPRDGRSFAQLYQYADEATYQAKHMGKNGCVFYAEMRESGALPPPTGVSVVNATIDGAPGAACEIATDAQSETGE